MFGVDIKQYYPLLHARGASGFVPIKTDAALPRYCTQYTHPLGRVFRRTASVESLTNVHYHDQMMERALCTFTFHTHVVRV